MKKVIFIIVTVAVIILAIVKNPSESVAKEEIKNEFIERINEKVRKNLSDSESTGTEKLGSALAGFLAPKMMDYLVTVNVSDYLLFSTFNANTIVGGNAEPIASGVILFGKIIPLKSDFDD